MPPWASRHIGGPTQGHSRYTDAREGRPWVAYNTIHSATNVHNQKTDTTVFNNVQDKERQEWLLETVSVSEKFNSVKINLRALMPYAVQQHFLQMISCVQLQQNFFVVVVLFSGSFASRQ